MAEEEGEARYAVEGRDDDRWEEPWRKIGEQQGTALFDPVAETLESKKGADRVVASV